EHSPADFDVLYYSRSDGMIFRTDKLMSQQPAWSDITDNKPSSSSPTDLECHPYNAYTVYMTSGTSVYKSENKGVSWKDISGSLPEIPMNSIIYDKTSDEGLYVATDAGVYYKDASMADWVLHGNKLPVSVEASEVEIYYDRNDRGESRLRASTFGRGLWEVGLAESDGLLPPALLQAVASTGIVELEWVAPFYPQNISGYNVYRNNELIGTANGTSYLDREVENEFTYEYHVTAMYVGSGESTASNTASATPLDDIELPYNQDFEKGNAGWNAKYAFDGWEYGNSDELKITGNDGSFFGINSGMAGAGVHVIDTLSTPKIDLSSYAGQTVTMKFRYTIRKYMDYDHLFIAYKDPVGNRWNIFEELQKPSGFGWPWGEVEMELPSDWLVDGIQIGFIYDDSNEHGWGAAIDDFQLYIDASSIFDLELASSVSVYPNPSNGHFEININQAESKHLSLEILDINGRVVYKKDLSNQSSAIRETIDLTQEAKGIYTLKIKNGSAEYQSKLTIQ
ncbi:MAG: T9SS type A sorting domain-containing protein, partial [Bacteroidales bacterium]|nr:T9SS type A sorting domain-containing protein [Bacteroidales bacterium]